MSGTEQEAKPRRISSGLSLLEKAWPRGERSRAEQAIIDSYRQVDEERAELLDALIELANASPCQNGCAPDDMTCASNRARAAIDAALVKQ